MMKGKSIVLTLCLMLSFVACSYSSPPQGQNQGQPAMDPAALDKVLAPIALYPDALVAQILMCSTNVTKVRDLQAFIQKNKNLKGTALQEAAGKQGFDPSYVALTLFPQVVKTMNDSIGWTRQMGQAFTADKKAVFASLQRLRTLALDVGNLKTTPQQEVQKVDQEGQQVIVIQPANPQVVYVPQYNPETIYTTPAPPVTQTIVVHEDDNSDAVAAGMIGFGVGVAMGAAMNNNYYYGPYGYGGYGMHYGGFYGAGCDDVVDHREDMREDFTTIAKTCRRTGRIWRRIVTKRALINNLRDRVPRIVRPAGSRQRATVRAAARQERHRPPPIVRPAGSRVEQVPVRETWGLVLLLGALAFLPSLRVMIRAGMDRAPRKRRAQRSSSGAGAMSGYERGRSTRSTSSRGRSSMGGGGGGRSRGGGGGRRR